MFNVVDFATGWKVDLIIRKARPFSLKEFERRRPAATRAPAEGRCSSARHA
jgi:hypothetical protein